MIRNLSDEKNIYSILYTKKSKGSILLIDTKLIDSSILWFSEFEVKFLWHTPDKKSLCFPIQIKDLMNDKIFYHSLIFSYLMDFEHRLEISECGSLLLSSSTHTLIELRLESISHEKSRQSLYIRKMCLRNHSSIDGNSRHKKRNSA